MAEIRNPLEHLKSNYENIESPLYFSGITKIYQYYDGKLSKREIENFLRSNFTYSIYREWKNPRIKNPTYAYQLRFQVIVMDEIYRFFILLYNVGNSITTIHHFCFVFSSK